MATHKLKIVMILSSALAFSMISLAACQLNREPPTQAVPTDILYTQAAETIIAQITQAGTVITLPAEQPTQATLVPFTQVPPTIAPSLTNTPPVSTPLPSATMPPTAPVGASPPPLPDYKMLRQEDFSSETGWHTEVDPDFVFEFKNGGYRITVNIVNAFFWSIWDRDFTDTRTEVVAGWDGGPQDGFYGLTCRHKDGSNYYSLVISSTGAYRIMKNKEGTMEYLVEGTAPAGVIRPDQPNRVTADCIGETLTLYANNMRLAQAEDDDFATGVTGMTAGTKFVAGFSALFDDFVLFSK